LCIPDKSLIWGNCAKLVYFGSPECRKCFGKKQEFSKTAIPYNFPFLGGNASGVRLVRQVMAKGVWESWQFSVSSLSLQKTAIPYNFPFLGGDASGVRILRRVMAKGVLRLEQIDEKKIYNTRHHPSTSSG